MTTENTEEFQDIADPFPDEDIDPTEFINEMLGEDNETTIESEVPTKTESTNTPTDNTIEEESNTDKQSEQQEEPEIDHSKVYSDKATNNLVLPDGTIVARAGRERRKYIESQQLKQNHNQSQQEVQRLSKIEQEYNTLKNTYNTQQEAYNKIGLKQEDMLQAAQLHQAWKSNPIETINYLLTQARAEGHNVEGLSSGNQLDMNAINQTIDQKLNPITEQYRQQQEQQLQQERTQQELNTFIATHEYSDIHGEHIAKIMNNGNMDASAAYWKLKAQATQLGLDFTKPLEPQAQAKLQGQTPSTTQTTNTVPGVGDIRSSNTSNLQTQNRLQQSSHQSFADIIRGAMDDNNYTG